MSVRIARICAQKPAGASISRAFFAIIFVGFFLITVQTAHAAIVITEIMYNPLGANTGHQWIEVTNTGPDSVDLGAKNIRLFDASGNHLIKVYGTSASTLAVGDIAVIAKDPLTFQSDYPSFSRVLLKSSFSLPVASGIIGILQTPGTANSKNTNTIENGVLDNETYSAKMGADGDGNSLQRLVVGGEVSGQENGSETGAAAFQAAAPTPGILPSTLPAPLAAPVKPVKAKSSSTIQARTNSTKKSSSKKSYGKGTVAPPTAAEAAVGGALPVYSFPTIPIPNLPVFYSPIFAAFLALLAFSSFSLILIERSKFS
jgi:hypothetical protein